MGLMHSSTGCRPPSDARHAIRLCARAERPDRPTRRFHGWGGALEGSGVTCIVTLFSVPVKRNGA